MNSSVEDTEHTNCGFNNVRITMPGLAIVVAGDNVWVPSYEPNKTHNENIILATFLAKGHANCKKDYRCEEGYACIISYILCPGNAGCFV